MAIKRVTRSHTLAVRIEEQNRTQAALIANQHVTRNQVLASIDFLIRSSEWRASTGKRCYGGLTVSEANTRRQTSRANIDRYFKQNPLVLEINEIPRVFPRAREPQQIVYGLLYWSDLLEFIRNVGVKNIDEVSVRCFYEKFGQTSGNLDDRISHEGHFSLYKVPGTKLVEIFRTKSFLEALAAEHVLHRLFGTEVDLSIHRTGINALNKEQINLDAIELSNRLDFRQGITELFDEKTAEALRIGRVINPTDDYTCPDCRKSFDVKRAYEFHHLSAHGKRQTYTCPRGDLCKANLPMGKTNGMIFETENYDSICQHGANVCNFEIRQLFNRY